VGALSAHGGLSERMQQSRESEHERWYEGGRWAWKLYALGGLEKVNVYDGLGKVDPHTD
ncbi:hypothetical protein AMTR_s00014p00013450, partial [Amborella trichopoda]